MTAREVELTRRARIAKVRRQRAAATRGMTLSEYEALLRERGLMGLGAQGQDSWHLTVTPEPRLPLLPARDEEEDVMPPSLIPVFLRSPDGLGYSATAVLAAVILGYVVGSEKK